MLVVRRDKQCHTHERPRLVLRALTRERAVDAHSAARESAPSPSDWSTMPPYYLQGTLAPVWVETTDRCPRTVRACSVCRWIRIGHSKEVSHGETHEAREPRPRAPPPA